MAYVAMAFIAMEQLRAGVGVWCPFFSRANGAHSHSLYSYGLFRVNRLHCVDEAIERPQKRRVLLELSVPTRTVDAASRSVKGDSRGSESEMVAPLGAKEERFGEVTFFFSPGVTHGVLTKLWNYTKGAPTCLVRTRLVLKN